MPFDPKLEEVTAAEFTTAPPPRDIPFLRWIGIVVSAFASFVTLINSYEWWAGLRPWWVAGPMAATLVGASVFLPDFGILLFLRKKRGLGGAIFLSGVIATLFCMVTTVAALYNTHTWRVEDAASLHGSATTAVSTLADRDADRRRLVEDIRFQASVMESTQRKIDALPHEDTLLAVSQTLQKRLLDAQRLKQLYERDLAGVQVEIERLRAVARTAPTRTDFYGFLGGIFKGDPATIEFLTAAIPAVFLEIVAPVMVAVVLFL